MNWKWNTHSFFTGLAPSKGSWDKRLNLTEDVLIRTKADSMDTLTITGSRRGVKDAAATREILFSRNTSLLETETLTTLITVTYQCLLALT
jgi:hypothetical protein